MRGFLTLFDVYMVAGQCKYRQARSQLAAVRELDSVLARVRGSSGTTAPVGILATNSGWVNTNAPGLM